MTTFTIGSWQDLAIIVGIASAMAGVIGGLVRARLDRKSAEAAASDRLLRLVETEAEKKVEVVRTEFKLQFAELQLSHQAELASMRADFDKQVKSLKREHDTYRCELAPVCSWRNKKIAPPPAVA